MTRDVSRRSWKTARTLVVLTAAFVGPCALCPVSNTLLLRPLLARFDSRYVPTHVEPMPFDPDQWRAGTARQRVGMARDLSARKVLVGKTRAELVEMLGEPDVDRPGADGTRWLLGFYAKGLFDETLWLEVSIGKDGIVSSAGVGTSWADPRER